MEELEDSIHQVIKSAVKAADFNRVMATVAKANKASETIVKGYEISKALIEVQESLKALMENIQWQVEELWQQQPWIESKYQRRWRSHEDIWSDVFGDMLLSELAKMDDAAFRQAVIEYCKSQIALWEKAELESPTNRLPTFEELFTKPEYMDYAIKLAKATGIINDAGLYIMGARGKYSLVALWYFLAQTKPPEMVNHYPGQKAIEAIARNFGEPIGKNCWSENTDKNHLSPGRKAHLFYQKLIGEHEKE